ncbi:MAG TPA: PEP/pyruvate-binding domain-containing protein [bacterium]|nr:PEP/pyruvate-binding domain-containing protein [bacterium]
MFTLGANPSSLGVLQTALTTAISGVSTETTLAALDSVRQIPSFQGIAHLSDLAAPENLARLAGNPLIYQNVAQALKLPADLGRQLFQAATAGAQTLPNPAMASFAPEHVATPAPRTVSTQRTASCSMDWEGADIPDEEVDDIAQNFRSKGEVANAIFTDIRQLQGKLRINPMEKRLQAYAEHMDLHHGVQIFRRTPSAMNRQLHDLLNMAPEISKLMDGESNGEYRDTLHRNHSRGVIERYLEQARAEGPEQAVPLLEKSLALYDEVYGGKVDLSILSHGFSTALKDELGWPKELTLENLGPFAAALRQVFGARAEDMTAEQRYKMMRLAICLDAAAFSYAAFREEETGTPEQGLKMAVLLETLYGTGFGDERWLSLAQRFRSVVAQWSTLGAERGAGELARYGVIASHILEEVKSSYHALFDDLVRRHGKAWGLTEEEMRSFTRSLYRTSALFPLGQHLAALHAGNGNHNRSEQILDRLLQSERMSRVYAPVFLGEGKPEDLSDMGNKGKGLNELIRMGEPVPAGFALPPVLMAHSDLTEAHLTEINDALNELERRTGKSFEDGSLKVSIRSGASVSMPGTLLTVIKVGSRREVIEAVRTVYSSWDNPSAQLYRRCNGVPEDFGTSVIVQEWVETADHPDSGFGLATSNGRGDKPLARYGRQVHGIDLVSGHHLGEDEMEAAVREDLDGKIARYEDHFRHPVEVEYAVERGKIRMLQIRRAQLNYEDEIRWAVRMIRNERMTREEGLGFLGGRDRLVAALNEPRLLIEGTDRPIASEAKGGGHPLVGSITFDEAGIVLLQQQGIQAIFVTDNADAGKSGAYAFEAGAAIFNEGNGVSHLEGDLRASSKPHLGGIPVKVDRQTRTATIGGVPVLEGDIVTLDPTRGAIYRGAIPIQQGDSPVASLIRWLIEGS